MTYWVHGHHKDNAQVLSLDFCCLDHTNFKYAGYPARYSCWTQHWESRQKFPLGFNPNESAARHSPSASRIHAAQRGHLQLVPEQVGSIATGNQVSRGVVSLSTPAVLITLSPEPLEHRNTCCCLVSAPERNLSATTASLPPLPCDADMVHLDVP